MMQKQVASWEGDQALEIKNIYDNFAVSTVLGYAEITSDVTSTSATIVQVTGLTLTFTPPGTRNVKITAYGYLRHSNSGELVEMTIWDGVVVSGTQIAMAKMRAATNNQDLQQIAVAYVAAPSGSKTYNIGFRTQNATGTATLIASATNPAFILAELL